MSKQVRFVVATVLSLVIVAAGAAISSGASAIAAPGAKDSARGARLIGPAGQVVEGDRFSLLAAIKSPAKAARVALQKRYVPLYGAASWETVKAARVRGRSKVPFRAVATDHNVQRYRVVVGYTDANELSRSAPVSVTIWRWIPLSEYDPYYETSGLLFGEASINGRRYVAWGAAAYSHARSWEARFTVGRHCKAFRGVLGVGDVSDDGSSGTIDVTADDHVVHESRTLTPGMDVHVRIPLAKPYRIGILLSDTSPEGLESWPVIGAPALLCTGV